MAKNEKYYPADTLALPVPAGTKSGDPVVVGEFAGVALEDRDAAGNAPVRLKGVFALSAKGHDGTANKAIAVGDKIYFDATATPKLSVNSAKTYFGVAASAVTAGATTDADIALKAGV